MSKVIFVEKNEMNKIPETLKKIGMKEFAGTDVLVKLHMGEENNKWYVKPNIVKIAVDELKKISARPFLYDTVVMYRGGRDSREKYMQVASKHGFTEIGCDVVIGDEGEVVRMNDGGLKFDYEVAKEIHETKNIFAVSHVKGHMLTGIGGAIKNFGMGGVSKKTKFQMHSMSVMKKVLTLGTTKATFGKILSLGAKACLIGKNVIYMSVMLDITKHCDCTNNSLPIICKDLGFLFSTDPVAIDAASVDLIEKNAGSVFDHDPWEHIEFAEKIGLGSRKYELTKA